MCVNAVARFDQVIGVSDEDRALAFANIEEAANYYGINLAETSPGAWAFCLISKEQKEKI